RGVTILPPLRTIPMVRALHGAHNGRVCSTWGNFHYKTFDGDVFRFPGLCNYVFSAHCGAAYEDFNIQVRRGQEPHTTTPSRIVMKLDGMVVELTKTSVLVNSRLVQLPFSQSGVLIQHSGSHLRVVARVGIVFMWNQDDSLLLELDPKYANQTCGLCGDFNGSPEVHEFLSHNTRLTPLEFGNLQKMDGPIELCQDPDPEPLTNCSTDIGICEEVLGSQLLAGCVALVDIARYLEACRQDLCLCEHTDRLSCVCHTLAEYSRQCAHAGGLPQDWRAPHLCPQTCPHNMQYHECRSPCADTCSYMEHSQACEDHCVAGCFCPDGLVFDDIGQSGCIPASQCACTYNGATYAPGAVYTTDCTNCTCSGGRWSCQEVPCPGTCSVLGGAHFSTFDEKQYTVHGDCSYVLAKPCGDSTFTVLAELRRCGLTDSETCLRSVTLSLGGAQTVVEVKASGEVFVNQIYTQLPVSTANVTLFRPSTFFIIAQTNLGLQVDIQLVPTMQVFVRLAPEFHGLTCGLCGNFNQNQADDFTALSGVVEGTAVAFANTWKTRAACPNVRSSFEDPCSLSVENEKYAQHWCSLLTDTQGPFAPCHAAVNPLTFYLHCMFDTCNCERSEDCLCAALSSYVRACAARGLLLHGWRDGVCKKPMTTCPKSMTYRYNISTCQPTCRALSEGDITCHIPFVPVDGCTCPESTVLDDTGVCVPATSCPCYHRGAVVPNGESVHDSGAICTCTQGTLSCLGGPAPTPVCTAPMVYFDCHNATPGVAGAGCQKSCYTLDMACYSSQCVPGCVCPDGLVADGEGGCIAVENCPCTHNEASYQAGQTIRVGCNTCTCDRRMWQCTDDPCIATCAVYGDGHYLTFDGQRYSFSGDCQYTLVQDNCGGSSGAQDNFRVVTENVPCGTTGTTCSKAIRLFLGSYELRLSNGKAEVIREGTGQELPFTIRQMGVFLVVDTNAGLELLWDRRTSIFIRLSPEFKGRVCGLCGNFDDSAINDFTTRSQSVVGNALEFGNSWKLSPSCPDALAPKDPCTANPYRKSWAQKQCSIINSATFAACHAHVEPDKYYEACVSDACACDSGGDCECFCTAVAAYAQACSNAGLCVSWRSPDICPLFCDYYNSEGQCEWHYQPCGAPCIRTCRNPRGDCLPDAHGLEGCYPKCPAEAPIFDEDNMQCVAACPAPPQPPPCRVHGKLYWPGATVPSDKNCHSCICSGTGVRCTYDAQACVCTYGGQHFHPGDVIYHTTDGAGGCISAHCGANGTIQRRVHRCSPSTPAPPTTFSFSMTPLVVASSASAPPHPSCGEECLWSQWLDVSHPGQGVDSGDFDTLDNLRAHGYHVCLAPREVQCRAEDAPQVPLHLLGQRVDCSPAVGLICYNKDQAVGLCDNYQIRVLCCTPLACPTSGGPAYTTPLMISRTPETHATLSTAGTVPTTVRTTPGPGTNMPVQTTFLTSSPTSGSMASTTPSGSPMALGTSGLTEKPIGPETSPVSCLQEICTWTEWIDGSYPGPARNSGDFDTFQNLRKKGYRFCERPSGVECRAESFPNTPLAELGQDVTCNTREGLLCLNRNQLPPICYNYEIRIQCCEMVDRCRDKPTADTQPTTGETGIHTWATVTTVLSSASTEHVTGSSAAMPIATGAMHTTHAVTGSQTTDCQPRCSWTKWFDVDLPAPGPHGGDVETYSNIIRRGEKICHRPEEITKLECRAENHPDVSIEQLGQVVRCCDRDVGLVCRNQDQVGRLRMCLNYEVRVLCCQTPAGCPQTTVTHPPTATTKTSSSVWSTSVVSTSEVSSSSAPSTRTCFCSLAGQLYPAETSPLTSTSKPVTTQGCPSAVPPRKKGETWAMPNCSQATCEASSSTTPRASVHSPALLTKCTSPAAPPIPPIATGTTAPASLAATIRSVLCTISTRSFGSRTVALPSLCAWPTAKATVETLAPCITSQQWLKSAWVEVFPNEVLPGGTGTAAQVCLLPGAASLEEECDPVLCRRLPPGLQLHRGGGWLRCTVPHIWVCQQVPGGLTTFPNCFSFDVYLVCYASHSQHASMAPASALVPWQNPQVTIPQTLAQAQAIRALLITTNFPQRNTAELSAAYIFIFFYLRTACTSPTQPWASVSLVSRHAGSLGQRGKGQVTGSAQRSPCTQHTMGGSAAPGATSTIRPSMAMSSASLASATMCSLHTVGPPTRTLTSRPVACVGTSMASQPSMSSMPTAQLRTEAHPQVSNKTESAGPRGSAAGATAPVCTMRSPTSLETPSESTATPVCHWSNWYDGGRPEAGNEGGDFETFENLRQRGYQMCGAPTDIECRAADFPSKSLHELGQKVACDRMEGLTCINREQNPPLCLNYELRVLCCDYLPCSPSPAPNTSPQPSHGPSTELPGPSTQTPVTRETTPQATPSSSSTASLPSQTRSSSPTVTVTNLVSSPLNLRTTTCQPRCQWTEWFDEDYPKSESAGGDIESYDKIRGAGRDICKQPQDIQCQAENFPNWTLEQVGQRVHCSIHFGLVCRNAEQDGLFKMCYNYRIRLLCCDTAHCRGHPSTLPPATMPEAASTVTSTLPPATTPGAASTVTSTLPPATTPGAASTVTSTLPPATMPEAASTVTSTLPPATTPGAASTVTSTLPPATMPGTATVPWTLSSKPQVGRSTGPTWTATASTSPVSTLSKGSTLPSSTAPPGSTHSTWPGRTTSTLPAHSTPPGTPGATGTWGPSQSLMPVTTMQTTTAHSTGTVNTISEEPQTSGPAVTTRTSQPYTSYPETRSPRAETPLHTSTQATTSQGRTGCQPKCEWTEWFDVDFPISGVKGGDMETFENIRAAGAKMCPAPKEVECRAENYPEVSIDQIGQVVTCSLETGLVCRNEDQVGKFNMCFNYNVRVLCCNDTSHCPSTVPTPAFTSTASATLTESPMPTYTFTASSTFIQSPLVTTSMAAISPETSSLSTISLKTTSSARTSLGMKSPATTSTETSLAHSLGMKSPATTSTETSLAHSLGRTSLATTFTATTSPFTRSSAVKGPSTTPSSPGITKTVSLSTIQTGITSSRTTEGPSVSSPSAPPPPSTSTGHLVTSSSGPTFTTPPFNHPSPSTGCVPQCAWTEWFNEGYPTPGPEGGDFETYAVIRSAGHTFCEHPEDIQCRSEKEPDKPLEEVGQVVQCNVRFGLVCRNHDQVGQMCLNYLIRMLCCDYSHCLQTQTTTAASLGTSLTGSPTLAHSITAVTVSTRGPASSSTGLMDMSTSCRPTCHWTDWLDTDRPQPGRFGGDIETYYQIMDTGRQLCLEPKAIECEAVLFPGVPVGQLGQVVQCDVRYGLICRNHRQKLGQTCLNYRIRVHCCDYSHCASTTSSVPTSTFTTLTTSIRPLLTSNPHTAPLVTSSSGLTLTTTLSSSHPSPSTGCVPQCAWTDWFDEDYPIPGPEGGDFETYAVIRSAGHTFCEHPQDIQCRSEKQPDQPLEEVGQVVYCDVRFGLVCRNRDQVGQFKMCLNYLIRVRCCNYSHCVSTTSSVSTSTPVPTVHSTLPNRDQHGALNYCDNFHVRLLCCDDYSHCATTSAVPNSTALPSSAPGTTHTPVTPPSSLPTFSVSTGSTSVLTTLKPTGSPSPPFSQVPCFCHAFGQLFSPGDVIYNKTDRAGCQFYAVCSQHCDIDRFQGHCPTTLPPASSSDLPPTSPPPGCSNANPPRQVNESWTLENCTVARCEGDNRVVLLKPKPVANITCVNGQQPLRVWNQSQPCDSHYECECSCSGWGDFHYSTFDGSTYSFLDNCTYVLVREIHPHHGNLSVLLDGHYCGASTTTPSCPRALIVHYESMEIILTTTTIRGKEESLVLFDHVRVSRGFTKRGVSVILTGIQTMGVDIPAIGVSISFDGHTFQVRLSFGRFSHNTEGQCGTCTNNKEDDCRQPDGSLAPTCQDMARSWLVPDSNHEGCWGPTGPPPTANPTSPATSVPTTASCLPDPLCELLLSHVFAECHHLVPPGPFFSACVSDSCRPRAPCQSLEAYAALCRSRGGCSDWRNATGGLCDITCPPTKVYKPCGPVQPVSCDPRKQNPLSGGLAEGCFCPEGQILFNTLTDICVPTCPCVGPDGLPKFPGERWVSDCQACVCDEGSVSVRCKPLKCEPQVWPPKCGQPGFVALTRPRVDNPCCPETLCVCNTTTCPQSLPKCGQSQVLTRTQEEDQCCPVFHCQLKLCTYNGTVYGVGATFPGVIPCHTCSCLSSDTQDPTVRCEEDACNTTCPQGFTYTRVAGQCCGQCMQNACVTPDGWPVQPNGTWVNSRVDNCTEYHCEVKNGQYMLSPRPSPCPDVFSCKGILRRTGCCYSCEEVDSCQVRINTTVLRYGDCVSKGAVNITFCEGSCPGASKYSVEAQALQHQCTCCQERRVHEKAVSMQCPDGSSFLHSYTHVDECGCVPSCVPLPTVSTDAP
uniref:Mucin 5AC, oligomeric mucus/gel-forming n=1 Tax=Otolemur garnettii TaxID=30611 RepID=H0XU65_OTOGA